MTRYRTIYNWAGRCGNIYFRIEKSIDNGVNWFTPKNLEGNFTIKEAEKFIEEIINGEREWIVLPVDVKINFSKYENLSK